MDGILSNIMQGLKIEKKMYGNFYKSQDAASQGWNI